MFLVHFLPINLSARIRLSVYCSLAQQVKRESIDGRVPYSTGKDCWKGLFGESTAVVTLSFFFLRCSFFLQANFNFKTSVIIFFLNQIGLYGEGRWGNEAPGLRDRVSPTATAIGGHRAGGATDGWMDGSTSCLSLPVTNMEAKGQAKPCFLLPSYLEA